MKIKYSKKVYVKKPKIGQKYWFTFAGGIFEGILIGDCEKLTKHYGSPYYMLDGSDGLKYPISIFALRYKKTDIKI